MRLSIQDRQFAVQDVRLATQHRRCAIQDRQFAGPGEILVFPVLHGSQKLLPVLLAGPTEVQP